MGVKLKMGVDLDLKWNRRMTVISHKSVKKIIVGAMIVEVMRSFFYIYITDNYLLLSPHVAMWRPLAHLWADKDLRLIVKTTAQSVRKQVTMIWW